MADKERILNGDLKNLREDLEKLRADFSNLASNAYEQGKEEFSHARESLLKNGKKQYDVIEDKLSERPMTTLISAFGVGLLLGYLGQRNHSKRD